MINSTFTIILTVFLCFSMNLQAQEANTYPPDGIYSTYSAFRNGKPDLVKSQLTRATTSTADLSIRQWVNGEVLYYLDGAGNKRQFESKNFWAFVENGTMFLYLGYKFHKITVLGQISYFLESYPTIKGNMAPVVTDKRTTASYRLLDMETGDILDYSIPNLEELLSRDENLYNEFKAITSQKTKRKKMYSFMERFNKAHPLRPVEL